MPHKYIIANYIGAKFTRLTVVSDEGKNERYAPLVKCVCDCGNVSVYNFHNLIHGSTKSCGCYNLDNVRRKGKHTKKHNLSQHPLYKTWHGMKNRCYNTEHDSYKHYGGRGVGVCDEWLNDVTSFYSWATTLGGYKRGLSIERLDVNKEYSPSNCTFVDSKAQSRNKRSSRLITIDGVTKNWIDWCRSYGMAESTVRNRINRGMSIEEALTKPIKKRG